MESLSTYPYTALNLPLETRVLEILPGLFNDPLVCSIRHIPIETSNCTPPFDALSYCWGNSVTAVPPEPDTVVACAWTDGTRSGMHNIPYRDLINNPNYAHLYYQTGGPRPSGQIVCDGVAIEIGGELYSALQRLREEDRTLRLWVDALCINQSDMVETNKHVKMMGTIYAAASTVHVWLGEELSTDQAAIEALSTLDAVFYQIYIGEAERFNGAPRRALQARIINDEAFANINWDALDILLRRAWFGRVWVIQEIAKSKEATVHIGGISIGWAYIASIISELRALGVDLLLQGNPGVKAIGLMDSMTSSRRSGTDISESSDILTVAEETREFKSTLPCDKIYGVLTLANNSDDIEVDYGLNQAEVYRRFAITHLIQREDIRILYHCYLSPSPRSLDLPSWVPDWTRPAFVEPFHIRGLEVHASGNTRLHATIDDSNSILTLQGKIVDRITVVEEKRTIPSFLANTDQPSETQPLGPKLNFEKMITNRSKHGKEWLENVLNIAFPNQVATEEDKESLWRTMMCNRTRSNKVPEQSCGDGFQIYLFAIFQGISPLQLLRERRSNTPVDADVDIELKGYQEFEGGHSKWTYNRRFCRTEYGRFGWVVDGTQVGDEIFIPFGGRYPLVLRPRGKEAFTIVGDCYLHGAMEGELIRDASILESSVKIE